MNGIILFILGLIVGGLLGIMIMCLLQINRLKDYEEGGAYHEEYQKYNQDNSI